MIEALITFPCNLIWIKLNFCQKKVYWNVWKSFFKKHLTNITNACHYKILPYLDRIWLSIARCVHVYGKYYDCIQGEHNSDWELTKTPMKCICKQTWVIPWEHLNKNIAISMGFTVVVNHKTGAKSDQIIVSDCQAPHKTHRAISCDLYCIPIVIYLGHFYQQTVVKPAMR